MASKSKTQFQLPRKFIKSPRDHGQTLQSLPLPPHPPILCYSGLCRSVSSGPVIDLLASNFLTILSLPSPSLFLSPFLPHSSQSVLTSPLVISGSVLSHVTSLEFFQSSFSSVLLISTTRHQNWRMWTQTSIKGLGVLIEREEVVNIHMLIFLSLSHLSLFPRHLALPLAPIRFSVNDPWTSERLWGFTLMCHQSCLWVPPLLNRGWHIYSFCLINQWDLPVTFGLLLMLQAEVPGSL